jgi:hypothetical protein
VLYKSHHPRPKDIGDFQRVAGALEGHRRDWLRAALSLVAAGHDWLTEL